MTRRVLLENLRYVDPVTLDILVQDAFRRPLVQLSAITVADLMALAEVESLPKALRRGLVGFAERMGPEIRDLPDGEPFAEWLTELESLPAPKVPKQLRTFMLKEIEARFEVRPRVQAILDAWDREEPEVVVPGTGKPVIHRLKTAGVEGAPAPLPRAPKAEGAAKVAKAPKVPKAAPVKLVDNDRLTWVRDVVLERLADYIEQGLREDVLLAGIKHRARADYPDLTPPEVIGVLKDLQTAGRVRHSAGRWRRVLGSW